MRSPSTPSPHIALRSTTRVPEGRRANDASDISFAASRSLPRATEISCADPRSCRCECASAETIFYARLLICASCVVPGLTVVKIGTLLERRGVVVPYRERQLAMNAGARLQRRNHRCRLVLGVGVTLRRGSEV
jgi:hypothetical protein